MCLMCKMSLRKKMMPHFATANNDCYGTLPEYLVKLTWILFFIHWWLQQTAKRVNFVLQGCHENLCKCCDTMYWICTTIVLFSFMANAHISACTHYTCTQPYNHTTIHHTYIHTCAYKFANICTRTTWAYVHELEDKTQAQVPGTHAGTCAGTLWLQLSAMPTCNITQPNSSRDQSSEVIQ